MENKVSVIIPNYNHSLYLKDRIDSVLNQTVQPFEIIILDDCSTDNSVEIIKQYAAKHKLIQFIKNETNSGSTFAQWNKGVSLAKGNLIWIAESDDKCEDTFLEKLIPNFINNDIVLSYCQSNRINSENIVTGNWKNFTDELDSLKFKDNFFMTGNEFVEKYLIYKNVIPNASAVLFKKEKYLQVNGTETSLKFHGDWLLWLKLLSVGDLFFNASIINDFRYHKNSVIAKANEIESDTIFKSWHAMDMRLFFANYLKKNKNILQEKCKNINNNFLYIDLGRKGLFYLKEKNFLEGWRKLIHSFIISNFKTGYIKLALNGNK